MLGQTVNLDAGLNYLDSVVSLYLDKFYPNPKDRFGIKNEDFIYVVLQVRKILHNFIGEVLTDRTQYEIERKITDVIYKAERYGMLLGDIHITKQAIFDIITLNPNTFYQTKLTDMVRE